MRYLSTKKQVEIAKDLGRSVAIRMYDRFKDPSGKYRGPAFVWPKTLVEITVDTVKTQAKMATLEKHEMVAVTAARRTLKDLLAQAAK